MIETDSDKFKLAGIRFAFEGGIESPLFYAKDVELKEYAIYNVKNQPISKLRVRIKNQNWIR